MAAPVAAPHGFSRPYTPAATSHPRIRKKRLQAPKLASQRAAARVRRRRLRRSIRRPFPTAERCAPAIAIPAFPALTCIALVSALPDCHAGLGMSRNKFSYSRALPSRDLLAGGGAVYDERQLAVERLDVARGERRIPPEPPLQRLPFRGPLHHEEHRSSRVEHGQCQRQPLGRRLWRVVNGRD